MRRGGATRLAHLYQRDPLRVLFPAPEANDIRARDIADDLRRASSPATGLRSTLRWGQGAAAHVTASAAEKVYRSTGATTVITQQLRVAEGAWLEYLPPETILFDGARLRRETRIELAAGRGLSRRRHPRFWAAAPAASGLPMV